MTRQRSGCALIVIKYLSRSRTRERSITSLTKAENVRNCHLFIHVRPQSLQIERTRITTAATFDPFFRSREQLLYRSILCAWIFLVSSFSFFSVRIGTGFSKKFFEILSIKPQCTFHFAALKALNTPQSSRRKGAKEKGSET